MEKKNIIIAGGGFAGLSVLLYLNSHKDKLGSYQIIVIDQKRNFEFLPMLPDVLASWLNADRIKINLKELCDKLNVEFVNSTIRKVDLENKLVQVEDRSLGWEYLVIGTGGKPNFFGNENAKRECFSFNNIKDTLKLKNALKKKIRENKEFNVVVVGGGYTGLEVATNSDFFIRENGISYNITVVDLAPRILSGVPGSIREESKDLLDRLDIKVLTKTTLDKCRNGQAILSSGEKIENAICVWTAGVKSSDYIDKLNVDKIKSRIKVNRDLTIKNFSDRKVFVTGDAAAYVKPETEEPLRMAIMFSISQGKIAAQNIINHIKGKPLKEYNPVDLGFLVPLAYRKAPGIVLGRRIYGKIGYFLHYLMCIYRSRWSKKFGIMKDLLLNRF